MFYDIFSSSRISKNLAFTKNDSHFPKIQLDGKHCDAIESRAKFWVYVGNQKHPNYPHRNTVSAMRLNIVHLWDQVW